MLFHILIHLSDRILKKIIVRQKNHRRVRSLLTIDGAGFNCHRCAQSTARLLSEAIDIGADASSQRPWPRSGLLFMESLLEASMDLSLSLCHPWS